ncbi:annexin ANXC4 [Aspergillus alliaceus]|uniref:annexin ANXC4 n=1 Tax=Petromyces alliaceus TaxID=209559 RepID=UPI0012A755AC|nr:uncharacterized protein BDW43DRAFT_307909 [Aspergillus alliaceus]KAB8236894.1 hypothetical protein BDW43DRAFT_307909 [Aspergillus alliaceus]
MSLQPDDPRSRGRSKSRHRSRSRASAAGNTYLSSEPADEYLRPRSRSRGYRTSSSHLPSAPDLGHYPRPDYLREDLNPSRSPNIRPVRYDVPSDDAYSDTDDEALAYGDLPGGLERGYYGYTAPSRASSSQVNGAMMSGALNGDPRSGPGPAPGRSSEEALGGHPSYAKPGAFKYVTPGQYLHAQPDWAPIPECERPGFVPPSSSQAEAPHMPGAFPLPTTTGAPTFQMPQYANPEAPSNPYASWSGRPVSMSGTPMYTPAVSSPTHKRAVSSDTTAPIPYANPPQYQYAQVDPKVQYASKSAPKQPVAYSTTPQYMKSGEADKLPQYANIKYSANPQFSSRTPTSRPENEQQYVEITPGDRTGPRPASHSVSSGNTLMVGGPDPNVRSASPMLEPYKGTYQSISPMPSPIVIPSKRDEDVSDLEPLDGGSDSSGLRKHRRKKSKDDRELKEPKSDRSKRERSRVRHDRHDSQEQAVMLISPSTPRKKVSFYDPEPDAIAMQDALSRTRSIDSKMLIRVLPHLTSEEILDLRTEYKKHVKLHGKSVNLAKHIRLKLGNSTFGKVCYATALGQWESEAFWANYYYQSSTSRRELLIESLFGRSNSEIRAIKDAFRDSRYLDSLEKCMTAELRDDKFRMAVLMALKGNRQSDRERIEEEVDELHKALVSRHGGETAMIYIIVRRSDSHLREVLRRYEEIYGRNFARAMIAKSQNLVGETLAHILNGVINRPMRDALLLHQALRESQTGKERSELLISRLVRLHWEPRHLEDVKSEFRRRYGQRLEEAIAEEVLTSSSSDEWGEFCIGLARSSKALSKKG